MSSLQARAPEIRFYRTDAVKLDGNGGTVPSGSTSQTLSRVLGEKRPSIRRRLAAVLHIDGAGYSRMISRDDAGTLRVLSAHLDLMRNLVRLRQGRPARLRGDGLLAEFPSVVGAVACALEIQAGVDERNAELPPDQRVQFRVGCSLGELALDDQDEPHGECVNMAVRIEKMAEPGGICVTGHVREQLRNKLTLEYRDLGRKRLRNIPRAVRVYRVRLPRERTRFAPLRRIVPFVAGMLFLVAALALL